MAEQTIDKVQIEVEASAKGVSNVFDRLERQLETLQKVLSSIDTSKLDNLSKSGKGTKVNVNTSGVTKAEKDVSKSVAKIEQALAGLKGYYNAAMNGDSSSATSFERRVISIQSAMDVLQKKFEQIGNVRVETDAFKKIDADIEKTRSDLESLQKQRQQRTDTGSDEYKKLSADIEQTETKLTGLINKQNDLVNKGMANYDPLANYKESAESAQNALNQMVASLHSVQVPEITPKTDNEGLRETSKEAKKARENLKKMFDKGVTKALDGLGKALKKVATSLLGIGRNSGGVKKGFMQILKYGFGIRSIYVLFRRLRKAVTESFKELRNSGAFWQTTRANLDALKNSLTLLKYQFGAAFEPIFNAVAPALKTFMNYLVEATNHLTAFFAKLTGKSTYSRAVLNAAALATNTGKAAKAQKELNKQLQGFDELNNLTTNDNNGSGSGSSKKDKVPGAVYVTEQVDNVLGDFGKMLAEKITAGDWRGVGQAISDKLSDAMESINWDNVFQKAKDFGHNLAEFLNGLINPRLFGNVAKTIANSLNTALYFLNEFGKTFDWKNFGESLAQGVNDFFATFDFKAFGQTIHTWIGGALDAATTFFEKADFKLIGEKIGEFLANLDIPDLAKKLLKLAKAILVGLGEAIVSAWNNTDAGGKFVMALVGVLVGIKFGKKLLPLATNLLGALFGSDGINSAAQGMKGTIGTTLGNIFRGVVIPILGAVFAFRMGESAFKFAHGEYNLGDFLGKLITGKDPEIRAVKVPVQFEAMDKNGKAINGLDSLVSHKVKAEDVFDTESFDSFYNKAKEALGLIKDNTFGVNQAFSEFGMSVHNAGNKLVEATGHARELGEQGKNSATMFKKEFRGIPSSVGKDMTTANTNAKNAWSGFDKFASDQGTSMNNAFKNTPNSVKTLLGQAYTLGLGTWTGFSDWVTGNADKLNRGFDNTPSNVSGDFSRAYSQSTNTWNGLGTWISGKSSAMSKGFNGMPSSVEKDFRTAFTNSTGTATSLLERFMSYFRSLNFEKKATIETDSESFAKAKSWYQELSNKFKDIRATFTMSSSGIDLISSKISSLISRLNTAKSLSSSIGVGLSSGFSASTRSIRYFASGGIVNSATPAIIGERGSEAVLPLTDGTLGTLSKMIVGEMARPNVTPIANSTYSANGMNAESVAEQNRLLREQNDLLRRIAEKEVTISSREVFNATRAEANNYYNRTGDSPFFI